MADWFVYSGTTGGTYDGTTVGTAWRTITRPLQGSDTWLTTNDTGGGPVTGAGDTVWFKDNHNEVWDATALSRILYSGSSDPALPVLYKADLAGTHFAVAGGGARPTINMVASNNAIYDDSANDMHIALQDINFTYQAPNNQTPSNLWQLDVSTLRFYRVNFTNCYGTFLLNQGGVYIFEDCTIDYTGHATGYTGALFTGVGHVICRRCTFKGMRSGIAPNTNRALYVELEECVFNNQNGTGTIFNMSAPSNIAARCRSVDFGDFTNVIGNQSAMHPSSYITVQDYDYTPRLKKEYHWNGTLTVSETAGDLRTGGADNAIVALPNTNCNSLGGLRIIEIPVWAPAGQSRNYTVYAKATGWGATPTAAELVFEVGYYNAASTSTRTWTASSSTVGTSYGALTVSNINPSEPGAVILRVTLYDNDGSSTVTIDPRPDVS